MIDTVSVRVVVVGVVRGAVLAAVVVKVGVVRLGADGDRLETIAEASDEDIRGRDRVVVAEAELVSLATVETDRVRGLALNRPS